MTEMTSLLSSLSHTSVPGAGAWREVSHSPHISGQGGAVLPSGSPASPSQGWSHATSHPPSPVSKALSIGTHQLTRGIRRSFLLSKDVALLIFL